MPRRQKTKFTIIASLLVFTIVSYFSINYFYNPKNAYTPIPYVSASTRTITCNGVSRTLTIGEYTDADGTTFEEDSDLILDQGTGACTLTMNGTFNLASFTLQSGVTVTHSDNSDAQTYTLTINTTGDIDIQSGGIIDVDGRGYDGGGDI